MNDWLGAIVKLAPFALAGVVVPSWTKYVVILLGTGRPTRNASMFVLGNAAFRLLLGVTAIWIHQVPAIRESASQTSGLSAWWLILPGLALWVLAVRLWFQPPSAAEGAPRWLRALEGVRPWMAFWTGFAMVALPGIQWVYFLSGVAVIAAAPLNTAETLVTLVALVAFLQLMMITPIVLFVSSGDHGVRLMARFKGWIVRNEHHVAAVVLVIFGGFMLLWGVGRL